MTPSAYLLLVLCAAIGLVGALVRRSRSTGYLVIGLILYGSSAGLSVLQSMVRFSSLPPLVDPFWYAAGRIGLIWGVLFFLRGDLRPRLWSSLALAAALFSVAIPLIIILVTQKLPHPNGPLVPTFEGIVYLAIALAAWASGRQDPRVRWVTLASLLSALFRLEWLLPLSAGLHHATVYLDHLALVALWPVLWLRPRQESLAKAS